MKAVEPRLTFEWIAKSYGTIVGSGAEPDKAIAATQAIAAADEHLAQPYRFKINLCEDGSVVTMDGEYIGTWEMDASNTPFTGTILLVTHGIRRFRQPC